MERDCIESVLRDLRYAAAQLHARLGSGDSVIGLTCCASALQALDHATDTLRHALDGEGGTVVHVPPAAMQRLEDDLGPTVADPLWHRPPLWKRLLARVL